MEIKIQYKGRIFVICIGHNTRWFSQLPLIGIYEEWYNKAKEVEWAKVIWMSSYKI